MMFSKKFLQFQKEMEPYVACVGWSNTMKYSSLLDHFSIMILVFTVGHLLHSMIILLTWL